MSKKIKWLSQVKEKILNIINVFRQIKLDDEYYKSYIAGMRAESQKMDSEFAKYDLKISDDSKFITYVVRLPEQFGNANDYIIFDKLTEATFFITNYLRKTVGLGMYVSVPEFFHIEDPTNPDIISTSYLARWTFQPMVEPELRHKYLTRLYAVITAFIVSGLALAGYLIFF